MVPLTPIVMVIRRFAFHPADMGVWMSGLYLLYFSFVAVMANLLWAICEFYKLDII